MNSDDLKALRAEGISKEDKLQKEAAKIYEKLQNYTKTGPLGSLHRRNVIDFEEISELLNRDSSFLADRFKMKNLLNLPTYGIVAS